MDDGRGFFPLFLRHLYEVTTKGSHLIQVTCTKLLILVPLIFGAIPVTKYAFCELFTQFKYVHKLVF